MNAFVKNGQDGGVDQKISRQRNRDIVGIEIEDRSGDASDYGVIGSA